MSPKHLTTLTQIVDFCLNNNWSMIRKSKRTNFFKDKGVGGVRVVPKPQKVSKEHEKIISIVFNQWVKLCSMKNTENPIKMFVQFFQKLSDQGLLRIDNNTDKFFTVCIYKAVERACASLNPFSKEYEDVSNMDNKETTGKNGERVEPKSTQNVNKTGNNNENDMSDKRNDNFKKKKRKESNNDQKNIEQQEENINKKEETNETNLTKGDVTHENGEKNESCRDTTDDSDDYDCFSSGDLTFYSNFSNADTDEENRENENCEILNGKNNKNEVNSLSESKKNNLMNVSTTLNESVGVKSTKEENAMWGKQTAENKKEERQVDSDETVFENRNEKNKKNKGNKNDTSSVSNPTSNESKKKSEEKKKERMEEKEEIKEKGKDNETEHTNVKTVAKTLEHIIEGAVQEMDTELNTEIDANVDISVEGERSTNLEKHFLLSNTLDTLALDCLAKMIISMMKLVDAQQISPFILFQKAMNVFCRIVVYESRKNKDSFNQRPYFRLFLSILVEINKNERGFESNYNKCILALGHYLCILNPLRAPMFVFAWLELISHRLFLPKILKTSKGWTIYNKLLIYLFEFLHEFLKNSYLTPSVQILYRGALRILLILLHDYPEFLCVYNFSICNSVALNCVQLRNLILSAFPRHIKLLDPFYPNLKVDLLPEMKVAPAMLNNFTHILVDYNIKKDVDKYFLTGKLRYLKNIYTKLFIRNKLKVLYLKTKYNIPLINALVLYIGISLPPQILMTEKTENLHPTLEIMYYLIHELDIEGRHYLISAIINHLRYPNSHTNNFSCLLLWIFHVSKPEIIKEQITGVMLERLIVHRPHPWGLLITFIELIKNPLFNFWKSSFVKASPEVEKLFASIYSTCLHDHTDKNNNTNTNTEGKCDEVGKGTWETSEKVAATTSKEEETGRQIGMGSERLSKGLHDINQFQTKKNISEFLNTNAYERGNRASTKDNLNELNKEYIFRRNNIHSSQYSSGIREHEITYSNMHPNHTNKNNDTPNYFEKNLNKDAMEVNNEEQEDAMRKRKMASIYRFFKNHFNTVPSEADASRFLAEGITMGMFDGFGGEANDEQQQTEQHR